MGELLGKGMYSFHDAARLVRQEPRYLRRWLKGYSWRSGAEGRSSSGPLWRLELDDEDLPAAVLSFHDLLELRMVATFLSEGVHMRVIRATIEVAAEKFGDRYPLINRRFLTDGRGIYLEAVDKATQTKVLFDVRKGQQVLAAIIRPSLFAGIEFDTENAPARWYPVAKSKTVVLDPAVQFGAPILAQAGIPTDTIYAAWCAEDQDRAAVARLYKITPAMVSSAVAFEQRLAA